MTTRILLTATIALALAACHKSEAPADAPAAGDSVPAAAETAAPAASAEATPAATGKVPTRDYIVGKWAMAGDDCSATIEYRADGAFVGPGGSTTEHWKLDGDKLSTTVFPGYLTVSVIDQKHMQVQRSQDAGGGAPNRVTRC